MSEVRLFAVAALLFLPPPSQAFSQTSVIVSRSSANFPGEDQIRAAFQGSLLRWTDGSKIRLVDQEEYAARDAFYTQFLNESAPNMRLRWQQLSASGEGEAPITASGDAAVLAIVASDSLAMGYVSSTAIDGSVRELLRIGGSGVTAAPPPTQPRQSTPAPRNLDLINRVLSARLQLDTLYNSATRAEAAGDPDAARRYLMQIVAISPQFRDASSRIARLESALDAERTANLINDLHTRALAQIKQGDIGQAIRMYQEILQIAPDDTAALTGLATARNMLDSQNQSRYLEREYVTGMGAFHASDWAGAITAFERILAEDPEYRDTAQKQQLAQSALDQESEDRLLTRLYVDSIDLINGGEMLQARETLDKIYSINPGYRDVKKLLAQVEAVVQARNGGRPDNSAGTAVDSLDPPGADSTAILSPRLAGKQTAPVASRSPERDVQRAERRTFAGVPRNGRWQAATIFALCAFALIPLAAAFMLSPAFRARLHQLRGHNMRAAHIYEQLLARNPGKTKYYSNLAHLYLQTSRSDPEALEVYKVILKRDLPVSDRDRIQAMVVDADLKRDSLDADAIMILENALEVSKAATRKPAIRRGRTK